MATDPSPAEPAAGLCRHSGDDMAPRRDELPARSYPAEPAGPRDYCAHTQPACDECRNPVETTPAVPASLAMDLTDEERTGFLAALADQQGDVYLDAARRWFADEANVAGNENFPATEATPEDLAANPVFRAEVDRQQAAAAERDRTDLERIIRIAAEALVAATETPPDWAASPELWRASESAAVERWAAFPWFRRAVRAAVDAAAAPLAAEVADLRERLAIVTEDRKARTLERDRLVDTLTALRAEVERLRAAALPEGGMWATDYGHDPAQVTAHGIEWHPGLHCVRDTYRRRVWYGPVEPVDGTEETGG